MSKQHKPPKPQMVKCRQCGKLIDKSNAIQLTNRFYMCSEQCSDEYISTHQRKPKEPAKRSSYTLLMDYIKQLDPNANFMAITAQLKRMAADYSMTYNGMRYALWYSVNIKNLPYKGIGILPYVYQESKDYWDWQQHMKQQVADWMPQDDDAIIVRRDVEENIFV